MKQAAEGTGSVNESQETIFDGEICQRG